LQKWLASERRLRSHCLAKIRKRERSPGFCVAARLFPTKQGPLTLALANTIRWYLDNAFGKRRAGQFDLGVKPSDAPVHPSITCHPEEMKQTASRQLVQQRLGLLQVQRIEALGEPAIDGGEKIMRLLPFTLFAPQPRHAHRRAQFPGLCLLLTRDS
jgi:hypothetical protein